MPSSLASASIKACLRAKAKSASVMVMSKGLAILRRLSTAPTATPMAASPRSGWRARRTRSWMRLRSRSVASSSSARLRARSWARAGLRQATRRSPG
jgi:hypothetical protein